MKKLSTIIKVKIAQPVDKKEYQLFLRFKKCSFLNRVREVRR